VRQKVPTEKPEPGAAKTLSFLDAKEIKIEKNTTGRQLSNIRKAAEDAYSVYRVGK
jgi:hypothetical protein